ncbi:MAG: hypothetical protein ABSG42_02240 [Nitrospirota bacterium]
MSAISSSIYLKDELENLRPILEQWLDMNKEYCAAYNECLYAYSERSTISSLAAAVWMSGGFAVTEFSHPKKNFNGDIWGDLWFALKDKEHSYYHVEAKYYADKNITYDGERLKIEIEKGLNEAKTQIEDSKKEENCTKLALVFIVPDFPSAEGEKYIKEVKKINQSISDIEHEYDLAVTLNPDVTGNKDEHYFPCVALLGRIVPNGI